MYQSAEQFSDTSATWHGWVWIEGCMFFTGDMVNLGSLSKWCGYVNIFAATVIAFIIKGEFTFKCSVQGSQKVTE